MQPEFYAWLAEVKHVDPELLRDRRTQQELWSTFEEDFNTATLPHEKFYSLEAWERSAAAAGGAAAAAACDEEEERDILREDEEALQRKRAEKRKAAQLSEVARSFVEMRENEAKIAEMLQQEELRRKQKLLWRTGDVAKAAKIAERLAPDPPK